MGQRTSLSLPPQVSSSSGRGRRAGRRRIAARRRTRCARSPSVVGRESRVREAGTRTVVTGAAGFIGSHLCDRLLADGHEVVGIDSFTNYYSRALKDENLAAARKSRRFALRRLDLAEADVRWAIEDADVVFHLAGRSGLGVASPAAFGEYVRDNIVATQRLLDAVVRSGIGRFVYAGSSSVYGDAERLPTKESALPHPLSTYGATKLAAENLVLLYGRNFGLPVTVLRYFTVYGPRQRPDMAISRFMRALLEGEEIEIHGDGEQTRDFTFVDDVVEATVRSATVDVPVEVVNLGGGSRSTINGLLATLEHVSGRSVRCRRLPAPAPGERHAAASINLARQRLGWEPRVGLREGLMRQWDWQAGRSRREIGLTRSAAAV